MLLRGALSSQNTPFAKLLRIAKDNRSNTERPVSPQVNAVKPETYRMNKKLTPAERTKRADQYQLGISAVLQGKGNGFGKNTRFLT